MQEKYIPSIVVLGINNAYRLGQMADLDYRESFANRLRNLRIAAGLSLEVASGQGGLSTNFWGSLERNEKEPCLNTIFSLAKGLGITASVLMALEDKDRQPRDRQELDSLLDLFTPPQLQLAIEVSKLIYAYKPGPSLATSPPSSSAL
jgi:transcriptional regulator with XRE-family HTH domain